MNTFSAVMLVIAIYLDLSVRKRWVSMKISKRSKIVNLGKCILKTVGTLSPIISLSGHLMRKFTLHASSSTQHQTLFCTVCAHMPYVPDITSAGS